MYSIQTFFEAIKLTTTLFVLKLRKKKKNNERLPQDKLLDDGNS